MLLALFFVRRSVCQIPEILAAPRERADRACTNYTSMMILAAFRVHHISVRSNIQSPVHVASVARNICKGQELPSPSFINCSSSFQLSCLHPHAYSQYSCSKALWRTWLAPFPLRRFGLILF